MSTEAFYQQALAFINNELSERERQQFEQNISSDKSLTLDFRLFQIEQYLSGDPPEQFMTAFEQEMSQDATLVEAVNWHRQTIQQIQESSKVTLRKEVKAIFPKNTIGDLDKVKIDRADILVSKRRRLFFIIAAAAVLLFLILAGNFLFKQTQSPEQLFAHHFQAYPMKIGERGTDQSDNQQLLNDAIAAYQSQQYAQAATLFAQYSLLAPDNPQVQLYESISHLGNGNAALAIPLLQALENDFHYQEQAQWYLALAYLKAQDLEQAKKMLAIIVDRPSHYYARQAKELMYVVD